LQSPEKISVTDEKKPDTQAAFIDMVEFAIVIAAAAGCLICINLVFPARWHWWSIPVLWIAAAGIPTILRGRNRRDLGLILSPLVFSLKLLSLACLMVFPLTYVLLSLWKWLGLGLPTINQIPRDGWLPWLLYQFLYVAVAEEIFFRGYVLGRQQRLPTNLSSRHPRVWQGIGILISALIFALFHVLQAGGIPALLTFFPALVFGWLLVYTRSLVAPVLFHGLANIFYAVALPTLT